MRVTIVQSNRPTYALRHSEGYVTIFSGKTTFKMAAELIFQFGVHVRYMGMNVIYYRTLLRVEVKDPDA